MTRRMLFQALIGAPVPQKFGATNTPQCPLCRTPLPADAPAYSPVVINATDATIASLPNVRMSFCGNCGVAFATAAK